MSSSTQYKTVGNTTLTASWSAKTYTITSGTNLTGSSISVPSSGTFASAISISSSGSATGYSYSLTNIKIYSGNSTSGTLLATINSTSSSWTMSGTYYSSIYVYATWTRSAIATTISASSTSVRYGSGNSGSITITAGGGGGKWIYSVISATRTYPTCGSHENHNDETTDPNKCFTLSSTTATSNAITFFCKGVCCYSYVNTGISIREITRSVQYTYVVQAESVYNGTKATITIQFTAS